MKKLFKNMALAALAVFALSSCEDVPSPYGEPILPPKPEVNIVTATCAEAQSIVAGMADGATTAETYEITGYITDVYSNISRGQQSFWMADTKNGGKIIQAYWANLPEGVASFTKDSKVKITGQLMKFINTSGDVVPEVKNADVVILDGEGGDGPAPGEPKGSGTKEDPYNVAAALSYISSLADGDKPEALVYAKGIISEVVKMGTSGSIQFKMSDDGQAANSLLVYYCDNLGKTPFKAATDLKAGDEVIVCGTVQNFKGNTPEFNSGSYLVSLNGKTEGEGGDSGDKGESGEAANTIETALTVSQAIAKCAETGETATTEKYYVKGIVSQLDAKYANNFYISVDGTTTNQLMFYYGTGINGATINMGDITVGDEVVVLGQLVNYKGNTPELAKGCQIITIKKGEGGGNSGDDKGEGGPTPTGNNLLSNGDFESWANGVPTNWQPTTTAGGATLTQSTDSHKGSYSVSIAGVASSNKRMGYKEMTLDAGTYVFSFYAKATTAEPCQTRPGYVPVTDGKVGSYVYGDYASLKTSEWTLVSYEFKLDETKTINLVIMNPKGSDYSTSQNILVDDATLIKK